MQPPTFAPPYFIGDTVSDDLGHWKFSTTYGLGGAQTIVATVIDEYGHTGSVPTTLGYPGVLKIRGRRAMEFPPGLFRF
jgi:hypothetical protein